MGCREEIRNDFLLEEKAPRSWSYQKTGPNSAVVFGELVSSSREFQAIPCPEHCFDLIRITGFPQEAFFWSRLFGELDRILHPQGKLCFNLTPPAKTAFLRLAGNEQPNNDKAEETIIYYGMKSGFTFTEKDLSPRKHPKGVKTPGYSLHLTLTDPTTPPTPAFAGVKPGQTLLWLIKGENTLNTEEDTTPES